MTRVSNSNNKKEIRRNVTTNLKKDLDRGYKRTLVICALGKVRMVTSCCCDTIKKGVSKDVIDMVRVIVGCVFDGFSVLIQRQTRWFDIVHTNE